MEETIETLSAKLTAAQNDLASARAALKSTNDEAKGHRLNSDNFRTQAEELKAAVEAAKVAHQAALDAAKAEAAAKVTEAETKATEALTKAQQRALAADLKVAAKDAGMVDLDGLKLLDSAKVKLNDAGEVTNAAELMAEMKTAKPFLFGTAPANTSNPADPPKPKSGNEPKKYADMTEAERSEFRRKHGIKR